MDVGAFYEAYMKCIVYDVFEQKYDWAPSSPYVLFVLYGDLFLLYGELFLICVLPPYEGPCDIHGLQLHRRAPVQFPHIYATVWYK